VIAFLRAHRIAFRTIVLLGVLAYVAYFGAWHFWREATPRSLGFVFVVGSLPWSAAWVLLVPSHGWGVIPGPVNTVVSALVVGFGFGFNVALVIAGAWFAAGRWAFGGLRKRL
jgi:hypothetical protein